MKNAPPEKVSVMPHRASAEQVLRRLEWTVVRRLDGLLQGDYRTLLRGTGLDLADLREYQLHDDVRHIDWNVTARMQQPHVRVFTEDREMAAWFLLDLSPSVDFGSGEQRKRHVSAEFVAVLARLLTRHGNRVGAVLYGSGVEKVIPTRGGRRHVLNLHGTEVSLSQPYQHRHRGSGGRDVQFQVGRRVAANHPVVVEREPPGVSAPADHRTPPQEARQARHQHQAHQQPADPLGPPLAAL